MKKIIFVADFFVNEIFGGGEIVNDEIIKALEKNNHDVHKVKCTDLTIEMIDCSLIIANFIQLPMGIKLHLEKNCSYSIIEHDHKYVEERDVSDYNNYLVPPNKIINREFYKNAEYVYCQSKLHSDIVSKNIGLNNVVNLSTSIWSDEHLDIIEKSITDKKVPRTAIQQIFGRS